MNNMQTKTLLYFQKIPFHLFETQNSYTGPLGHIEYSPDSRKKDHASLAQNIFVDFIAESVKIINTVRHFLVLSKSYLMTHNFLCHKIQTRRIVSKATTTETCPICVKLPVN